MCPGVLARPQLQATAAAARLHGSRLPHRARQEPRRVDWPVLVVPPLAALACWGLAGLRTRDDPKKEGLSRFQGPMKGCAVQLRGPAEVANSAAFDTQDPGGGSERGPLLALAAVPWCALERDARRRPRARRCHR